LRELSDEELERVIWGQPANLPPMSKQQRREVLRPMLELIAAGGEKPNGEKD
jgi:hypothetical protein